MHIHAQYPIHMYTQSIGAHVFWQVVYVFGTRVVCVCTACPTRIEGVSDACTVQVVAGYVTMSHYTVMR